MDLNPQIQVCKKYNLLILPKGGLQNHTQDFLLTHPVLHLKLLDPSPEKQSWRKWYLINFSAKKIFPHLRMFTNYVRFPEMPCVWFIYHTFKLKYIQLKCYWDFIYYKFCCSYFTLITADFSDHSSVKLLFQKNKSTIQVDRQV